MVPLWDYVTDYRSGRNYQTGNLTATWRNQYGSYSGGTENSNGRGGFADGTWQLAPTAIGSGSSPYSCDSPLLYEGLKAAYDGVLVYAEFRFGQVRGGIAPFMINRTSTMSGNPSHIRLYILLSRGGTTLEYKVGNFLVGPLSYGTESSPSTMPFHFRKPNDDFEHIEIQRGDGIQLKIKFDRQSNDQVKIDMGMLCNAQTISVAGAKLGIQYYQRF
jgi:hypothetical protein